MSMNQYKSAMYFGHDINYADIIFWCVFLLLSFTTRELSTNLKTKKIMNQDNNFYIFFHTFLIIIRHFPVSYFGENIFANTLSGVNDIDFTPPPYH